MEHDFIFSGLCTTGIFLRPQALLLSSFEFEFCEGRKIKRGFRVMELKFTGILPAFCFISEDFHRGKFTSGRSQCNQEG